MKVYVLLNILLSFFYTSQAQGLSDNYSVEIEREIVSINDPVVISVILYDTDNRPQLSFPDLEGFEKQSRSAVSSIRTVEGKKIVTQKISQHYYAKKPGKYQIPSFKIQVNGLQVEFDGTEVTILAESRGEDAKGEESEDVVLIPDASDLGKNIFLSVQADKKSVYMREGFLLSVSLYVAKSTPIEMEFYQINKQLQLILKQLRPLECWEENIGIEEIVKREIRINGMDYTEYNMFKAQLFPLTLKNISFPSVTLEMLVVDRSGEAHSTQKVLKAFSSKPFSVVVKSLPAHPFKDQVPVGQYQLVEQLSSEQVYSMESVRYLFKIQGKGNVASIPAPDILNNSSFDAYPPDVSQDVKRSEKGVTGEKMFDYYMVPKLEGVFPLRRYFQWVYFDPAREVYDTLRSNKVLTVKGDDFRMSEMSTTGATGLYDNLEKRDSTVDTFSLIKFLKEITNGIIVVLLIAMIWVFRNN
jgi:hypothetical protein